MDLNDTIRNPWHGCQNCYAYFLGKRYGRDTNEMVKNKSDFTLPIKKIAAETGSCPPARSCASAIRRHAMRNTSKRCY